MADDDAVRLDTRLAGKIRRYHTWPISQQQSIAEHTWQILRIYMSVVHDINPAVVFRMVFHDVGEHSTGDLPFPVKRDNPELKVQVDILEQRAYATQLDFWDALHHAILPITNEEAVLMKQIELVEMAEFGLEELCVGNQYGFIIADRCLKAVYMMTPQPSPRLVEYVIKRLRLFFDQCRLQSIANWHMEATGDWWFYNKWEDHLGCK